MIDKFDSFFSLAGKHISALEKIVGFKLKKNVANEVGYAIVDILNEGYELSRKDNQSVAVLLDNQLYRKGKICEIGGLSFYHQSTKYVKVVGNGLEFDFNLTNLPNYNKLNEFMSSIDSFTFDDDAKKVMEHNKELAEHCHALSQSVEVLYWRKVAKSIHMYHKENKRNEQARKTLSQAGFTRDEIEGYIPSPHLKE